MRLLKSGKPSEHMVQAAIVEALQLCGLHVQETTAYRQKGSSGVDKGVPDLLVWCPGLPVAIGIEVKADANSKVSPEQQEMVAAGYYKVAWTPEMALESVKSVLDTWSPDVSYAYQAQNRIDRVLRSLKDGN